MRNLIQAAIIATVLILVFGSVGVKAYQIHAWAVEDDLAYRGFETRYVTGLITRLRANPMDKESRVNLADALYTFGFYQEADSVYRSVYQKPKSDLCQRAILWHGGDAPNANAIDVEIIRCVWQNTACAADRAAEIEHL